MSGNVIGRLAFAVVGAFIAGPIGFSIGMSIGGMIFAPDGPTIEGPRIGDTSVSSASMGKVIPHHYGVTRSGGNVIYSAGLKEVKTEEEQGGKGGPTATSIDYTYFASFAIAFGRAPGRTLRRMWADGKLLYDSSTSTKKAEFTFVPGGSRTPIHPMIAESINRRLAGMDDINVGNQDQETHTTFDDLIAQAELDQTPRGRIYAAKMRERQVEAIANAITVPDGNVEAEAEVSAILAGVMNGEGIVDRGQIGLGAAREIPQVTVSIPQFRMTPSYAELCYVVFDDMPLEDYGNRIPNITAEIEWDIESDPNERPAPALETVPTLSAGIPQGGLMGTDAVDRVLVTDKNGNLTRFSQTGYREDRQFPTTTSIERVLASNHYGTNISYGTEGGTRKLFFHSTTTLAPTASTPWNKLDFANCVTDDLHAVRYPKQTWNANEPTASAALGFLVATDQSIGLFYNGTLLHTAPVTGNEGSGAGGVGGVGGVLGGIPGRWDGRGDDIGGGTGGGTSPAPTGNVTRSGPFTTPYRQNDQTKVVMIRYGEREVELRKVYLIAAGLNNEVDVDGRTRIVGRPAQLGSARHELEAPAAIATGPTIDSVSLFVYDHAQLDEDYNADNDHMDWRAMFRMSDGTGRLRTSDKEWHEIPLPPTSVSGYCKSIPTGGYVLYGVGRDLVELNVLTGTYEVYPDIFTTGASNTNQVFLGEINALLTWDGAEPVLAYVGRTSLGVIGSRSLAGIVQDVCRRAGMEPDEYNTDSLDDFAVHGFSVARQSSARQVLETLLVPFRVDGVERDYSITFQNRSATPVRTIHEDELGSLGDDERTTNFAEIRAPEYDLPAEINLNFPDPGRDYETNTAQKRRIAKPVSTMDSLKVQNIELPVVMRENDARDLAETILFQRWLSRDRAKAKMSWSHMDLDPADVVSFKFKDGRVLTDRLDKITTGSNFEIEVETVRAGDPVFTPSASARITSTAVPTQTIRTPVPSEMFVFDIPLLEDFHDPGRAATRLYLGVGAVGDGWRSAAVYESLAGSAYFGVESVPMDVTWGQIVGTVPPPRALWSTDYENEITVYLSVDKGNVNSVSREEILNGMNRALIWHPTSGNGEVIQFQDATVNADGSITLSTLQRGLRGTDYAARQHEENPYFFLLSSNSLRSSVNNLDRIGITSYFKAVSSGQLISQARPVEHTYQGNDQKPWAPSRIRRSDDGTDLTLTWNRRTRLGGIWNTSDIEEITPMVENIERYEVYLIDGADSSDDFNIDDPTTYVAMQTVSTPTATFDAAALGGLDLGGTVKAVIYQRSATVGRGFPAQAVLAP